MMAPVPAAVANAMIVNGTLYADTDVGAKRADMRAHAHALAARARACADRADIGARADLLRHSGSGHKQCG